MNAAAPKRSIARELFDLALPLVGILVMNVLALFVDTVMCAHLPDAETALAALSYGTSIVFLLMTGMIGLSVGTVALVARAHGAGVRDRVDHILLQSTELTVLVGLASGALGIAVAGPLLTLLGATPEVRAEGVRYLVPVLAGAAPTYLVMLYASVFRGVGNTRIPFLLALVTNGVNFVLNYALILGNWGFPSLGTLGAGIGTGIAYLVTAAAFVWVLRRPNPWGLRLALRPARLDPRLAREFFSVGAPAALDTLLLNATFLAAVAMLGRLGDLTVAAHGVGVRVQALAFVPGLGISMAAAALVGQALGAGDVPRAREVTGAAVRLSVGVMSALGILFLVFAGPIVRVFEAAPGTPLGDLSIDWIRILGYGMPAFGVHLALVGLLQGSGATRTGLRINAVATLVQIPLAGLLGFAAGFGAAGVWWSFPLAFCVKAALEVGAYRRGAWAKTGLHA